MPRWPTGPFTLHRTGCYRCVRNTPADGSCGIGTHPCMHPGDDLFAASTQVYAPDSGVVVATGDGRSAPWVGYNPGIIEIRGDSGKYLLMAHLDFDTITVKVGDRVVEGQPIARFNADVAHCHFEVRHKPYGPWETNTMDPAVWVAGGGSFWRNLALAAFVGWGAYKLARSR